MLSWRAERVLTSDKELVTLTTACNQLEAELLQGVLAEHGIPALLDASGVPSYLGLATRPVRLLVRPRQRAEAEQVLATFTEHSEAEGSR